MESLRQLLDGLVDSGELQAEYDNQDPERIARYRVSEDAIRQVKVQRVARMPRRARRPRKEQLTIEGAA